MITGASVAYGLTVGGYAVDKIEVTDLAKQILRPTYEGQDLEAKRAALLQPRIISEFLKKYNGSPIPKESIAVNVLEDMGAPRNKASKIYGQIIESADELGLITNIKEKKYVDLEGVQPPETEKTNDTYSVENLEDQEVAVSVRQVGEKSESTQPEIKTPPVDGRHKKVFITHGKNRSLVGPIKQFLTFGEMEPVVSVEKTSVSEPIPEKVMNDMRMCGAAIIHVTGEETLLDKEGNSKVVLNPNVLIKIGAAMALYGKRFILLVQTGTALPSNLQGLFEVRYEGDDLGSEATVNLLKAIKDMKDRPLN